MLKCLYQSHKSISMFLRGLQVPFQRRRKEEGVEGVGVEGEG